MSSQAEYSRLGYPDDWVKTVRAAILRRADGVCEWPGCEARAGEAHPVTGAKVILQVAHWDHDIRCNGYFDLYAFCQLHHNLHDRRQRQSTRFANEQRALEERGQRTLPLRLVSRRRAGPPCRPSGPAALVLGAARDGW